MVADVRTFSSFFFFCLSHLHWDLMSRQWNAQALYVWSDKFWQMCTLMHLLPESSLLPHFSQILPPFHAPGSHWFTFCHYRLVLPILDHHINRIIPYVHHCVWLFLLNMVFFSKHFMYKFAAIWKWNLCFVKIDLIDRYFAILLN